jgi:hypothetical protein
MRTRRVVKVVLLVCAALSLNASVAQAIPAFARKYRVSCNVCHDPAPRLNAFWRTVCRQRLRVSAW